MFLLNSSPPVLRGLCVSGAERLKEWRWWITPRNLSSRYSRTGTHMNSSDCESMNKACTSTGKAVSHGGGGSGHRVPPLSKKLSAITDTHQQRENQFSPIESHWVYHIPYTRTGPMPSSSYLTQNKLYIFCGLFVLFLNFLSYCFSLFCVFYMLEER